MGRKRTVPIWEQSIKELLAKYDLNPIEELLKMAREEIELKPGDEEFIAGLLEDHEVIRRDGKEYLRPKLKHRKDLWMELAQYVAPKLRSSEVKGQIDYNFNITIKKFEDMPETHRIVDVESKALKE